MTTAPTTAATTADAASLGTLQVTDEQLNAYAKLVYARTGVHISPQKKTLLSNRLRRRLRVTGLTDFDAYYKLLVRLAQTDPEWDAFLQEITTHETYLFRDEVHWEWFRKAFIPELTAGRKTPNQRTVRIWSCAASTGDEAFTLAACLAAGLAGQIGWKVQIVGTDIGVGALEQARAARFGSRAMKLVPEDLKRQFFTKLPNADFWRANETLTAMVQFKQHNLMEPLREAPFDLAILKNVLIYFDAASKAKVMQLVRAAIKPGGYLLAGASEGVSEFTKGLEREQPWLFRQPLDSPRTAGKEKGK